MILAKFGAGRKLEEQEKGILASSAEKGIRRREILRAPHNFVICEMFHLVRFNTAWHKLQYSEWKLLTINYTKLRFEKRGKVSPSKTFHIYSISIINIQKLPLVFTLCVYFCNPHPHRNCLVLFGKFSFNVEKFSRPKILLFICMVLWILWSDAFIN
jgi:hypothetical protein